MAMSTSGLHKERIVIVQQALQMGGAERQGLLLARHLTKVCGCAVEFWGLANPGEVISRCDDMGIPSRLVPCDWDLSNGQRVRNLLHFARQLRAARPDVLLPYTNPPNVICGLIWRLTGARTCVWNQRDVEKHRMGPGWERWATRLSPMFVSNSRHGAEFLAQTYAVPLADIRVIYNGVETQSPQMSGPEWRTHLGAGPDDFVACMVANIHEHKDQETVIRAWQYVARSVEAGGRNAFLLLAGFDHGKGAALRTLAAELDVAHAVKFMGPITDVAGVVDASDICVFCAWREGVPNGVLECMIRGLPVTGSDIPGVREAVGEAGAALLAPSGDAEGLAHRILELAADRHLRDRLGDMNRRRITTLFGPDRMCRDMEDVIVRGLSRNRKRGEG